MKSLINFTPLSATSFTTLRLRVNSSNFWNAGDECQVLAGSFSHVWESFSPSKSNISHHSAATKSSKTGLDSCDQSMLGKTGLPPDMVWDTKERYYIS